MTSSQLLIDGNCKPTIIFLSMIILWYFFPGHTPPYVFTKRGGGCITNENISLLTWQEKDRS